MDREKVLKGLVCHGKGGSQSCRGCPYELTHGCQLILCHDAIALLKEYELYIQHQKDGYAELEAEYNKLLKEQEAVEPIPYHRSDGTIFKYECRQCRTKIFKMDLFCRRCGRKVKWDV